MAIQIQPYRYRIVIWFDVYWGGWYSSERISSIKINLQTIELHSGSFYGVRDLVLWKKLVLIQYQRFAWRDCG